MNDKQLHSLFSQARRSMPPALEKSLLAIPASEAAASKRWVWAVSLAASVSVIYLFGDSLVRLIKVASYMLGAWSLERLNTARYALYDSFMSQASPWIENVPFGISGAVVASMAMTLGFMLVIIARQQNASGTLASPYGR